jgi:hypothetical protein
MLRGNLGPRPCLVEALSPGGPALSHTPDDLPTLLNRLGAGRGRQGRPLRAFNRLVELPGLRVEALADLYA